jgi:arginase family enzyme
MKYMAACLFIVIGLLIFVGNGYAEDKDTGDLSREKKSFRNYSGQGSTSVSSFCIEGHVFVMVSGDTSNAQSLVQVYEEKNGRIAPKRCK